MMRWRRFARWSGFGCEVCGRLRFAYGPLCRACATEDFDRTARVYAAERYDPGNHPARDG